MKILITGGCGFLGSNLASHFIKRGDTVIIADALYRKGSTQNLRWLNSIDKQGLLEFKQIDVAERESVDSLFRLHAPFDYICHVAGQVAMTTSIANPLKDLQTNILGTFNILESCREHSPNALIAYSSTNKVYGDLEWLRYEETETRYKLVDYSQGLNESIPLDFSTPYGCSKGSADQYVRDWARIYGLHTVIFRHSTIYGGRQFASFDQGWIGWFCLKALEQKMAIDDGNTPEPFTIAGTGKQVRDILHANDLVSLYQAAIDNKDHLRGEIFNIGGGLENSLSLLELFNLLSNKLDLTELAFNRTARRSSDQDCFIADIRKVKKLLDWQPRTSKEEGILEILNWTREIFK
jgi:CDP-paratose 2-epimerase